MPTYELKPGQEAFEPVHGPMAGRQYVPGRKYTESDIPPAEKSRFRKVSAQAVKTETVKAEPAKTKSKKE